MLNYTKLACKPKQFLSITGITPQQFDFLSSKIRKEYKTTEQKRLLSKNRKRKRDIGAGRKFDLSLKDRILMLLMYYRMYTTYDVLGMMFGLDKSNVMRGIRYLEPAVKKCIPIPAKKYADAKKLTTIQEIEEMFPEFQVIIDATEQPIPRPKSKAKKRSHWSGKRRCHTVKNQYIINLNDEIICKPPHSPGRPHDYRVFCRKHPVLPSGLQTSADLGYEGMKNNFMQYNPVLPHKKQKGQELTVQQKEFNRCHYRIRIKVEHAIAHTKKFRILKDVFRNRLCRYDGVSEIVCGLVNFKIRWKEPLVVIP